MKKLFLLLALLPLCANAQVNNVGSCGWGSKLFDGQRGIIPQVFAVTTNGTSGNQTFAISSGTSGCTQNGVVKSSWKTAAYIDANMNRLAKDTARGQGESLDVLASLLNVQSKDNDSFKVALKDNFSNIFSSDATSSKEVISNLKSVLASNSELAQYSKNI